MKSTVDGAEVFVGQGGVDWAPGRQTLVLQHGAGMDRTVWVLLARYFARHGFNLVCPDLPAHGASTGKALGSVEEQAAFLWRLLDHLQANHGLPKVPVILGGHSMGALVTVDAAGQQPQRVRHLLLLGTGYPMPVAQPLLDAAAANEQSAVDMIAIYSHCLKSQLGHNAVAGINIQQSAMALLERAAPGVLHADLAACDAYTGLEKAASSFVETHRCRKSAAGSPAAGSLATLIIGAEDRMTPMKMSRNLAQQLQADVVVLADCGHMVMSEQPEQTLQAMRRVLL